MAQLQFRQQAERQKDCSAQNDLLEADKNIFQNSVFTRLRPGLEIGEMAFSSILPIKETLVLRNSPLQFGFHLAGRGRGQIRRGQKTRETIEAYPGSVIYSFLPGTTCVMELPENEHFQVINVYLERDFLRDLFSAQGDNLNSLPDPLPAFLFGRDKIFFRTHAMNPRTRLVLEELTNCPYHGGLKKMYKEAKVMELLALQFGELHHCPPPPRLCQRTKEGLYAAREILKTRRKNPPTISELAKEVGLSESLVKKGFRILFETTPHAFVLSCRLEQAQELLLQKDLTVSEIAWQLGFCDPAHFVRQFKSRFGLTPGNYAKTRL